MNIPDIYDDYCPHLHENMGAFINSNSWGNPLVENSYTMRAFEFDKYVFEHPEFLVLAAASNDGSNGMGTVNAPSTAKNVVTVGASQSPYESFQYQFENKNVEQYYTMFCKDSEIAMSSLCALLSASSPCSSEWVHLCTNFTSENKCCQYPSLRPLCCNDPKFFPTEGESTEYVSLYFLSRKMLIIKGFANIIHIRHYSQENLADFSSKGPTFDNRYKPDIVAPGHFIYSAKSHSTSTNFKTQPHVCGVDLNKEDSALVDMPGTSMGMCGSQHNSPIPMIITLH